MASEAINFYKKYRQRLYNVSYRILWDQLEAEDAVQETIIKYLKADNKIDNQNQLEAWLVKTCTRLSIDSLRRRSSMKIFYEDYKKELEGNQDAENENSDSEDDWNILIAKHNKTKLISLIYKELSCMADGYRTVLSMILLEGMDYKETAEYLSVAESTVRSQYMRGKKILAEKLKTKLNRK